MPVRFGFSRLKAAVCAPLAQPEMHQDRLQASYPNLNQVEEFRCTSLNFRFATQNIRLKAPYFRCYLAALYRWAMEPGFLERLEAKEQPLPELCAA